MNAIDGAIVDIGPNGNVVFKVTRRLSKEYEWMNHATGYYKKQCPNSITLWANIKFSENPLWFGTFMKNSRIRFLTKAELIEKTEKAIRSKSPRMETFVKKYNIKKPEDVFKYSYTPFENEKDVLVRLIEEDMAQIIKEFELNEKIKKSIHDLTNVELKKALEEYNTSKDAEEDHFKKPKMVAAIECGPSQEIEQLCTDI